MEKSALKSIILDSITPIVSEIDLSQLNGKKVLVTGSTGLIGINLLAILFLARQKQDINFQVTSIIHSENDDFFKEFLLEGDTYVSMDLVDANSLSRLSSFEYIFHGAGYGQPLKFMENQVKTIILNTTTTSILASKLTPAGRMIFISTSEVYSGLSNPPFTEIQIGTTSPQHPRSCYIEGKRCGEAICGAYTKAGKQCISARLALAYGPGVKTSDQRVINTFIQKAIKNKTIDMLDAGLAKRTYCYVQDALRMLLNIWLHGTHDLYNIGGVSRLTIRKLADHIASLSSSEVILPNSNTELTGSPDDVYLDISRYEEEFGKHNFVDISTGLASTIAWYKELLI